MAVKVNLATSGVVGVTGLTSGVATDASFQVPINSVIVLTGDAPYTLNLPVPAVGESFEGVVIYFKNLVDVDPLDPTRTFRVDFESGIVPVEGDSTFVPFTFTINQPFSFFYVNPTIGWIIR